MIDVNKPEKPGMAEISLPQLLRLHSGKVRESFRLDADRRLLVVTDRISCFDQILKTPIPDKGAVLNGISAYWFERVRDLCPSHFIAAVDPAAMVVREAMPIRVEVIVRAYLTGSAWREYQNGTREFSGVRLPDGLSRNQRLDPPIITPTTKEKSDRPINPEEIVSSGLASEQQWQRMTEIARHLFSSGTETLASRNLLLVDTKYEFGLIAGEVALIDEIHTPDSSRFWFADSYQQDPLQVRALDKEFVRQWLLEHKNPDGTLPENLPADVLAEARRRYLEIFHMITGKTFDASPEDPRERLVANLARHGLIRDAFVAIIMGSAGDREFAQRIADALEGYDVAVDMRVVSAHKNGERLAEIAREYNSSGEPGVIIAVAGRSNGLGGALSANLNLPVINCPPFKDLTDYSINIHSSLQMPSDAPAMTILSPAAAAQAAIRCLNRRRLRDVADIRISQVKAGLLADDQKIRGR